MKENVFNQMLERIYSAFGRERPKSESPIYKHIQSTVGHLPEEAVPWITSQVCDYEKMPTNLAKSIYAEWSNWLEKNPQKIARADDQSEGCSFCDRHSKGWFSATDGKYEYKCKCKCNNDPRWNDYPALTQYDLTERGLVLCRERDAVAMQRARQNVKNWRAGLAHEKAGGGQMQGVLGAHFKPRPDHLAATGSDTF